MFGGFLLENWFNHKAVRLPMEIQMASYQISLSDCGNRHQTCRRRETKRMEIFGSTFGAIYSRCCSPRISRCTNDRGLLCWGGSNFKWWISERDFFAVSSGSPQKNSCNQGLEMVFWMAQLGRSWKCRSTTIPEYLWREFSPSPPKKKTVLRFT